MRINRVHNINFNGYKAILAYGTTDKNALERYTLLAVKLDNEGKKDLENYQNLLRYYKDNVSKNKLYDISNDTFSILYKRLVNPRTTKIHKKHMFFNDIELMFGKILRYNRTRFQNNQDFQKFEQYTIKVNAFIADLTSKIAMQNKPIFNNTTDLIDIYIHSLSVIRRTNCMDNDTIISLLDDASKQKVRYQNVAGFLYNVVQKSMDRYFDVTSFK